MSVRLQFVCESAISSRAICWFTQGEFSHVDAVLPNGWLLGSRDDRVGGAPRGVHRRPQGYLKFARRVVFEIPATPEQSALFYHLLEDQIGAEYDTGAIWGFVFGRRWHKRGRSICSALQIGALVTSGIAPKQYFPADRTSPDALVYVVCTLGGVPVETD